MKFSTPCDMTNLDLLSTPMTIISFHVQIIDGDADYMISIYFETSIEVVSSSNSEIVDWL